MQQHNVSYEIVSCPNCKSNNSKILFSQRDFQLIIDGMFTIVRCTDCNLVFTNPRIIEDDIHLCYQSNSYYFNFLNQMHNNFIKNKIKNSIKRKLSGFLKFYPTLRLPSPKKHERSLLEIGCGWGGGLIQAKLLGWKNIVGVDFSSEAQKIANENKEINFLQSKIANLPYESNSFDCVIGQQVLEHMHDPKKTLKEIFRVLKPGGTIYLEVPNFNCHQSRKFCQNWRGLELPRHLIHFEKKSLNQMLKDCGFKKIKTKALSSSVSNIFLGDKPPIMEHEQKTMNCWWRKQPFLTLSYFIAPLLNRGDTLVLYGTKE